MLCIAASPPVLASGLLASAASVPGPDLAKVRNSGLCGVAVRPSSSSLASNSPEVRGKKTALQTPGPVESTLSGYFY